MTDREQIIELAKKCGSSLPADVFIFGVDALESFAQAVRNAALKEAAEVCDELRHPDGYSGENVDWCAGTTHCRYAILALIKEVK